MLRVGRRLYSARPLNVWTEEQAALRAMVGKFAADTVGPRVQAMDEEEKLDPTVLKGLFEHGVTLTLFIISLHS